MALSELGHREDWQFNGMDDVSLRHSKEALLQAIKNGVDLPDTSLRRMIANWVAQDLAAVCVLLKNNEHDIDENARLELLLALVPYLSGKNPSEISQYFESIVDPNQYNKQTDHFIRAWTGAFLAM